MVPDRDSVKRALFTVNNKTLKKYNAAGKEDWRIKLKGKSVKLGLYAYGTIMVGPTILLTR